MGVRVVEKTSFRGKSSEGGVLSSGSVLLKNVCLVLALAAVLVLPAAMSPAVRAEVSPAEPLFTEDQVGCLFGAASSHIKLYPGTVVERELDSMHDARIGWLRCDFAWFDLEPQPGAWDFSGTDKVVEEAGARGIRILGILGTSPPWANGGNGWNYPPTDMQAWRNYVRTVVSRYRGRVPAWEIWNEENIEAFWQPEPDLDAYLDLLAAASGEIRSSDPLATVVMGGVAGLDPDFLSRFLERGGAEYVDAVAYHPYPETIGEEGQPEEDTWRPKERLCRLIVDYLRNLISLYTTKELEVWVTEVGWTTCPTSPPGVDPSTQASYMLRTMINYASAGVDRVFWYNLRDTNLNELDMYGLLGSDFTPKASYRFFRTFQEFFGRTTVDKSAPVIFSCSRTATLEAHCFRSPEGDLVLSAWKSDDAQDLLDIRVNDPSLGNPVTVDPRDGTTVLTPGVTRDAGGNILVTGLAVGKTPLILCLKKVRVSSVKPSRAYQHTLFLNLEDVAGGGFQEGAVVRLEAGGRVVEAFNVVRLSGEHLSCVIGLWGIEPGDYDLVVINPDGSRARLVAGFKVLPLCGPGSGAAALASGVGVGLLAAALPLRRRRSRGSARL